jgi:hypothetical protein
MMPMPAQQGPPRRGAVPPQIEKMAGRSFSTIDQMLNNKTDPKEVNLRPCQDPKVCCDQCSKFQAPNQCQIVAGKVAPNDTCDAFTPENENTEPGGDNPQEDAAETGGMG